MQPATTLNASKYRAKQKTHFYLRSEAGSSIDKQRNTTQKDKGIPRRRKPVLQWQGHRALELQAELEGQGRQKLDNQ